MGSSRSPDEEVGRPVSNPLLTVSRRWAARARHALRLEWLAGRCIEWRLLNEVMTSEQITKVAVDMKGKVLVLRERDVLVRGYMEDPQLANSFLATGRPESEGDVGHTPEFLLPLPAVVHLPPSLPPTSANINMVKTCHVAVATMRVMSSLEVELKKSSLFETFINIEM